ncbi:hypothetical protein BX286_6123 [Streptomyces sp. 3211.6]|uniref:hypothetical protein n=1 Tax=Streptomyces sp. 3211.6 TaxID=1938845 RepID=UPI000F246845|nr:hypothetical protein [Streptomyces sp. 3211.6]RKT08044.1 hypothetical protein BX286_6123 [Streptomyces sp. 3211.6]
MPLPQPHIPRSHRSRRRSRHAAAAPAAGRRAVRRPPLLPASGRLRPSALCGAGAALVSLLVAVRAGALSRLWEFLDFGVGVLSLVSLTATVLWGLAATDRAVLGSGHRLLAQGVHRGLAVAGLGFLALHVWVKVAQGHTTAAGAFLPFADADRPVLIGLGTLAGYLFVAVAVSGAVRSVFAVKNRSVWWRALHIGAYPAWGASLVHGLKAGRAADPWVTASYALCLAGVAAVIVLRLRSRRLGAPPRPAAAPQPGPAPAPPQGSRPSRGRPGFVQDVPLTGMPSVPGQRTAAGTSAAARPAGPPPGPGAQPYAAAATAPAGPGGGEGGGRSAGREGWL